MNMKYLKKYLVSGGVMLMLISPLSQADTVVELLDQYSQNSEKAFSATRGEMLWKQTFIYKKGQKKRSCVTCHTGNLQRKGKHIRTGKVIQPMAPSVNSKRLTKKRKVEKWFKRNCKWTYGRLCTPQEKGDILTYLSRQ